MGQVRKVQMTDTLERSEAEVTRRKPRRRAGRLRTVLFVVLLAVAGFVATGVLPVGDYLERGNAVEAAQLELDRLIAENDVLAADIDALYTEQEVERIAREQYGFVREGEVGYVVIPVEPTEAATEPAESLAPVPVVEVDRSFLRRIWDFVTGNDQAPDG
jgi:cell division protein FtsB